MSRERSDIPLRYSLAAIVALIVTMRRNKREWAKAEASLHEAAQLWGKRLREQDRREDDMLALAQRQVRLGWISLGVAMISLAVAVIAVFA
jgi:hypothetical protein